MESLLKKEFKERDVKRARNLINKDFTSSTRVGTGYSKVLEYHSEGEIWEEDGKQWTIQNGVKRNISKLEGIKKLAKIPLRCPKCGGPMEHWLAKKMYKIHGFCFDPCTVEYEAALRRAGLYEAYEKRMMQGNIKEFIKDMEAWVRESLEESITFVTEQGDVEDWKDTGRVRKDRIMEELQDYIKLLKGYTV